MNQFLKSSKENRRVLVVDDELINRELLQTILSLNYDVTVVSNGMDAMDALRKEPEAYSLILLDIIMPQMSGFDVINACMADDKIKNIPIIVMTSEKSAEVRSIRMGAADFIAKPYRMPEVILARCERIIAQSEERDLIRSIEMDKTTQLYVRLFFDAYLARALPSTRGVMDAIAIRIISKGTVDGQREWQEIVKKAAELFKSSILKSKGIGCRDWDNLFIGFCRHKANYDELIGNIQSELNAEFRSADIRLKAGICQNPDRDEPTETWFKKAIAASDSISESDSLTAVCDE